VHRRWRDWGARACEPVGVVDSGAHTHLCGREWPYLPNPGFRAVDRSGVRAVTYGTRSASIPSDPEIERTLATIKSTTVSLRVTRGLVVFRRDEAELVTGAGIRRRSGDVCCRPRAVPACRRARVACQCRLRFRDIRMGAHRRHGSGRSDQCRRRHGTPYQGGGHGRHQAVRGCGTGRDLSCADSSRGYIRRAGDARAGLRRPAGAGNRQPDCQLCTLVSDSNCTSFRGICDVYHPPYADSQRPARRLPRRSVADHDPATTPNAHRRAHEHCHAPTIRYPGAGTNGDGYGRN